MITTACVHRHTRPTPLRPLKLALPPARVANGEEPLKEASRPRMAHPRSRRHIRSPVHSRKDWPCQGGQVVRELQAVPASQVFLLRRRLLLVLRPHLARQSPQRLPHHRCPQPRRFPQRLPPPPLHRSRRLHHSPRPPRFRPFHLSSGVPSPPNVAGSLPRGPAQASSSQRTRARPARAFHPFLPPRADTQ